MSEHALDEFIRCELCAKRQFPAKQSLMCMGNPEKPESKYTVSIQVCDKCHEVTTGQKKPFDGFNDLIMQCVDKYRRMDTGGFEKDLGISEKVV